MPAQPHSVLSELALSVLLIVSLACQAREISEVSPPSGEAPTAAEEVAGLSNEAGGSVRYDVGEVGFTAAYAFRDQACPDEVVTDVLLTDRSVELVDPPQVTLPMPDHPAGETAWFKALGGADAPARAVIRVHSDGSKSSLFVWEARAFDPRLALYGISAPATLPEVELTVDTPTRIAGRWKVASPLESLDTRFTFDLEFDASVDDLRSSGAELPPQGGEPGDALRAYLAALDARDVARLREISALAAAPPIDADEAKTESYLSYLRRMTPRELEVLGGRVHGDEAVLVYRGRTHISEGGRIRMSRRDGRWTVRAVLACRRLPSG